MKNNKIAVIDLSQLYLGFEHFQTYLDDEHIGEGYSIEVYTKRVDIKSDKVSRSVLINIVTGDEITIDGKGNCVNYKSNTRDVFDINGLHSFIDCISIMIEALEPHVARIENGVASLEQFKFIRDFINEKVANGESPYMEAQELAKFMPGMDNIYVLSYGDPFTGESKEECLRKFNLVAGKIK
jgi:hypothetical protein